MSMHGKEAPPPIEERYRIPLRVVVIVGSYLLYFVLSDERLIAAIFLGLGSAFLGLSLVDRWTLRRSKRSGLLQVGLTILALAFLGLGLFFLIR